MSRREKSLRGYALLEDVNGIAFRARKNRRPLAFFTITVVCVLTLVVRFYSLPTYRSAALPPNHASIRARCASLPRKPSPPGWFPDRTSSDRFVPGTRAVLVRNATIWTGRVNGLETIKGDVVLDKGLVKAVGVVPKTLLKSLEQESFDVIDAKGAWLTPGYVMLAPVLPTRTCTNKVPGRLIDLHTHLGVDSSPELAGATDYNSEKGLILPHLRALDGLNTHDDAYEGTVAGGVTTALVLPGSGNGIGRTRVTSLHVAKSSLILLYFLRP